MSNILDWAKREVEIAYKTEKERSISMAYVRVIAMMYFDSVNVWGYITMQMAEITSRRRISS